MNGYEKFLNLMESKAREHKTKAKEFSLASHGIDSLNDTKYHDGMADMASLLKVEFEFILTKELGPRGLFDNIDDPIDPDIDEFSLE